MRIARQFTLTLILDATTSLTLAAPKPDFSGSWDLVVHFQQTSTAAVLTIEAKGDHYEAHSGPIDEFGFLPLQYEGRLQGTELVLHSVVAPPANDFFSRPVGTLTLALESGALHGRGRLYRVPMTVTGTRPAADTSAPQVYHYVPTSYVDRVSADNPPILHIKPGDAVETTTLDTNGLDEHRQWGWMPGNTQTGPFYIDGAMPGDTLVVHLDRVRVNQDRAEMACRGVSPLPAGYATEPPASCDFFWILDGAQGTGRPEQPSPRLKNFIVKLHPMIGTIAVAPPLRQAIAAMDLGNYGGNLDYNQIGEGTTLYLPVYCAGALLSLGDAHALQGDGEVTGQGLETTMSVKFTVDLIKGKSLGRPWAENADFVMVSGIGNSLDDALRAATAGMSDWLKQHYQLSQSDIAMVLGTSIRYDVAEVVDPRPHVVAKLSKDVLAQIQQSSQAH
jgi:amidase